MRREQKAITDRSVILQVLTECHVGRLGTRGKDGYPMVKPLNFVFDNGNIFFHTAREGEKIDDMRLDNRVCFEVDQPIALVKADTSPCRAEYLYRSVIIKGRAHILEDRGERLAALKLLMRKYQPEGGYGDFAEDKLGITGVVRIEVEQMVGKEDLGKGKLREAAQQALQEHTVLPIVLERS